MKSLPEFPFAAALKSRSPTRRITTCGFQKWRQTSWRHRSFGSYIPPHTLQIGVIVNPADTTLVWAHCTTLTRLSLLPRGETRFSEEKTPSKGCWIISKCCWLGPTPLNCVLWNTRDTGDTPELAGDWTLPLEDSQVQL